MVFFVASPRSRNILFLVLLLKRRSASQTWSATGVHCRLILTISLTSTLYDRKLPPNLTLPHTGRQDSTLYDWNRSSTAGKSFVTKPHIKYRGQRHTGKAYDHIYMHTWYVIAWLLDPKSQAQFLVPKANVIIDNYTFRLRFISLPRPTVNTGPVTSSLRPIFEFCLC